MKKLNSWVKMLEKARAYVTPELMAKWYNIAMAYQLRHLARRAVTLEDGKTSVEFINRSLLTYWGILFEEPYRTVITVGAAYFLWFMPRSLYHQLESVAIKIVGATQRRRISDS
jgi:hypothetical protein